MKTFLKIISTTVGLGIIWTIIGIVFVPIEAVDHYENYFYSSIAYTIFFFLPVSILLFSVSKRLRVIPWIFVALSVLAVLFACYLYFTISDFQRNGTLFDIIYSIPLFLKFFFGAGGLY